MKNKFTNQKRDTLADALSRMTEDQRNIIQEALKDLDKIPDKKCSWQNIWALGFLAGLMNKKTL